MSEELVEIPRLIYEELKRQAAPESSVDRARWIHGLNVEEQIKRAWPGWERPADAAPENV